MRIDRPVIELPRLIDVRPKAIEGIANTLRRLNQEGKCAMIVGKTTMDILGEKILGILEDTEFEVEPHFVGEATTNAGEEAVEILDEIDAKFVLAVGGGTKIDIAKYASFEQKIPFISIPTVASHDGIASSRASLKGMDTKHSFQAHSPLAVIGDVQTIANAPRRYTISGCADIISNKTAVLDWRFSNRLTGEHVSQYAVTLSELIASTMIDSKDVIATQPNEGAYTVIKGLITSSISMCIAGSSRPASGAEHMISHKLDHMLSEPALHGEQCGVASIVSMYFHGGDWKEIRDVLNYIGAPITAKEINVEREDMIEAVATAHEIRKDRYTILSQGVSHQAAENALVATGIIP